MQLGEWRQAQRPRRRRYNRSSSCQPAPVLFFLHSCVTLNSYWHSALMHIAAPRHTKLPLRQAEALRAIEERKGSEMHTEMNSWGQVMGGGGWWVGQI